MRELQDFGKLHAEEKMQTHQVFTFDRSMMNLHPAQRRRGKRAMSLTSQTLQAVNGGEGIRSHSRRSHSRTGVELCHEIDDTPGSSGHCWDCGRFMACAGISIVRRHQHWNHLPAMPAVDAKIRVARENPTTRVQFGHTHKAGIGQ